MRYLLSVFADFVFLTSCEDDPQIYTQGCYVLCKRNEYKRLKKVEPTSWEHVLPDLKNFKNEYKLNSVATTTLGCRIIFLLEFLKKNKRIFDYLFALNPPNHIYQEGFKRMKQPWIYSGNFAGSVLRDNVVTLKQGKFEPNNDVYERLLRHVFVGGKRYDFLLIQKCLVFN